MQMTGLGQPLLLERMSEVLAEAGGTCDRGHSSANLEQVMAARLTPAELQAFRHMWRRLVQLSAAVHDKVGCPLIHVCGWERLVGGGVWRRLVQPLVA